MEEADHPIKAGGIYETLNSKRVLAKLAIHTGYAGLVGRYELDQRSLGQPKTPPHPERERATCRS